MKHALKFALAPLILSAGVATAASVAPTSYDMQNGFTGSFNYWDDSYTGAGANMVDGAALTGGLGDLTDGIIATENWFIAEPPRGPNGPYVGWLNINPTITFNFAGVTDFSSATFYFDDADGNGGVSAPLSVTAGGATQAVVDPAGPEPFAFTYDLSGFAPTDALSFTITRNTGWTFLSEVTFETAAVPVPATGLLLLGGLGGLGAWRRRKG